MDFDSPIRLGFWPRPVWFPHSDGRLFIEAEKIDLHYFSVIYDVIDQSDGYYRCPVEANSRSHMNVVFRLPSEDLEAKFLNEAGAADLLNLKGHRSVGGCRASIYNAMPMEGVRALGGFMESFRKNN